MGGPPDPGRGRGRAALLASVGRRARNELLFCLAGVPLGLCLLVVVLWLMAAASCSCCRRPDGPCPGWRWPCPSTCWALGLAVVLATRVARRLGTVHRRLAAAAGHAGRVAPAPGPGPGPTRLAGRWAGRRPGWRAVAYQAQLPLAILEAYAVLWWAGGWST